MGLWPGDDYFSDRYEYLSEYTTVLKDLLTTSLNGLPIRIADHCYGCTAGQGSSCGGALGSDTDKEATLNGAS